MLTRMEMMGSRVMVVGEARWVRRLDYRRGLCSFHLGNGGFSVEVVI